MDRVEVLRNKVFVNGQPLSSWVRSFYKPVEVGTYDWAGMLSRSLVGLLREVSAEKGFTELENLCVEVDQKHREGYLLENDFARIALVLRRVFSALCTAERDKLEWENRHNDTVDGLTWVEREGEGYRIVVMLKDGPKCALTERGFKHEGQAKYTKRYSDYFDCIDACSGLVKLGIKCVPWLFG